MGLSGLLWQQMLSFYHAEYLLAIAMLDLAHKTVIWHKGLYEHTQKVINKEKRFIPQQQCDRNLLPHKLGVAIISVRNKHIFFYCQHFKQHYQMMTYPPCNMHYHIFYDKD